MAENIPDTPAANPNTSMVSIAFHKSQPYYLPSAAWNELCPNFNENNPDKRWGIGE